MQAIKHACDLDGENKLTDTIIDDCIYNESDKDACRVQSTSECSISCSEINNCRMYMTCDKRLIRQGTIVKHFKGNEYTVLNIAEHVDGGKLVIYIRTDGSTQKVWARDYDEFMSPVDNVKYPNVSQKYRFEITRY